MAKRDQLGSPFGPGDSAICATVGVALLDCPARISPGVSLRIWTSLRDGGSFVSALALTSTIFARPDSSKWVNFVSMPAL
jgi:hypothetical protein